MDSDGKDWKEQQMEDNLVDIGFRYEGKHYTGWIRPSGKLNSEGKPASFHVVLDKVFFGNVSKTGEHWASDEPRPESLIQAVGNSIEKHFPAT